MLVLSYICLISGYVSCQQGIWQIGFKPQCHKSDKVGIQTDLTTTAKCQVMSN